jgi:CHAP domain-containing protein
MNLFATIALWFSRWQLPSTASAVASTANPQRVITHETQTFGETLAKIAESQVGHHEQGGNNLGPDVVEYQKATWLTPGAWAWCAAFVCWCVWHTITTLGMSPTWKRPRTAGAYDMEEWATGKYGAMFNAFKVFVSDPRNAETWPRRGDVVTFTWSHIGIVTGYDKVTKRLQTVEGNAGMRSTTDTAKGDGVVAKEQHITSVRRLIRYVG